MSRRNERCILSQCAPTLSGVKIGSLVKAVKGVCNAAIDLLTSLSHMDVGTKILRSSETVDLYLVYRISGLTEQLLDPEISVFLDEMGYPKERDLNSTLDFLSERMSADIQHEIGVFLGYPLCDVKGFIENEGKHYKALGIWKVYGDVENSLRLFNEIKRARTESLRQFDAGHSLMSIVAA